MNMLSIDLKSLGHRLCRFKPGSGYQKISSGYRDNSVTAFFVSYFLQLLYNNSALDFSPRPFSLHLFKHSKISDARFKHRISARYEVADRLALL